MRAITSSITLDREYLQTALTLGEQLLAARPLPLAVNGLSGGGQDAFLVELARQGREMADRPVLLLVADEKEGNRLSALMSATGLPAVFYPAREWVFHNISASHDVDRERLSVLSELERGETPVVITTP